MSSTDHLGTYAEGWTKGDASLILQSVSNSYVFEDPSVGSIGKADFGSYFADLKQHVESVRGGRSGESFMVLADVMTSEEDNLLTAWCWWTIPGTGIQGSGLIKVGDEGVLSERIAYFTPLAGVSGKAVFPALI